MTVLDPQFRDFATKFNQLMEECVNTPSFRGGYWAILQANQIVSSLAKHGVSPRGRRVIDLGCGATRPTATSILMHLLGAKSCLALDIEKPTDFPAIALAEYANVISICSGLAPLDYATAGQSMQGIRQQAVAFDLAALLAGDLHGGLPDTIKHVLGRYQDLSPLDRGFDLMISMSVWEHIADLADVVRSARAAISADGFVFTAVDFRDHRVYGSAGNAWQYLIDDSDYQPGYLNKIRYSAMCALIEAAGFAIASVDRVEAEPPSDVRAAILPKYAKVSEVDLKTVEARFLLRPA